MASLTIRKLDDSIKAYLRLRSAHHGRSVEEEVRVILGELIEGYPQHNDAANFPSPGEAPARAPRPANIPGLARVTLIIGGGIAAYKALDLIRRLKERHIHVRCVLLKRRSSSLRRWPPARCRTSGSIPTCSIPRASSTPAISGWHARRI